MTSEQIWRTGTAPEELLYAVKGRVSDRQLRLFACAVARLYWDRLPPEGRQAVEAAERYLEAPATYALMVAAGMQAAAAYQVTDDWVDSFPDVKVIEALGRAPAYADAWRAASVAATPVTVKGVTQKQQRLSACAVMREVFGDPFAPPRVDPAWFAREGGIVPKLARSIHDERAFDRLPILGDALEEAGCHDEAILSHCRSRQAAHARGCWVVELFLNPPEEETTDPECHLILPRPAWLVTCRVRRKAGEAPLPHAAQQHLVPLLARPDPEFVVALSCPEPEEALRHAPLVRSVKKVWYVTAKDGVALAEAAAGRVEDGPSGRAWLYTKYDKALADLAEVYEPVRVLMGLRVDATRGLATAALEGDPRALARLVRLLAEMRDGRAALLHALLPGMPALAVSDALAPAPPPAGGPDDEVAELQARATPCPRCGQPRRALRVKKEGPNQGRLFLACSDRKCDSFEWAGARTAPAAAAPPDPFAGVLRRLREAHATCLACDTPRPVVARATRPGPNQGRIFMKCNHCEKFDWLTDEAGDFMEPDFE